MVAVANLKLVDDYLFVFSLRQGNRSERKENDGHILVVPVHPLNSAKKRLNERRLLYLYSRRPYNANWNHYLSSLLSFPFPIRHVLLYDLCCLCRTMLPTDRFNKISFWIYSTQHVSSAKQIKSQKWRRKARRIKPTH